MKCEHCQQLVLSLDDPARPSKEIALHLANCADCRELVRRLIRIEHDVVQIPVPPPERRDAFLQSFLARAKPIPKATEQTRLVRVRRILRRWAPVAAAAAILILAGLWLGNWAARTFRSPDPVAKREQDKDRKGPSPIEAREKETPPETSLAAMVLECDLELAGTKDPVRRVEILARLGHRLRDESRWLARAAADKELSSLSRLHARVLNDGLLPRARVLPLALRRRTLEPITLELSQNHAHMKTWEPGIGPETGRRLEEIAHSTELAALALKELMEEATP